MANAFFKKVAVTGIVTVVPNAIKSIDDEIDLYGGDQKQIERIKKSIGLDKRHVVLDGTTAGDLCGYAAENLIKNMSPDIAEIDGVLGKRPQGKAR